MFHASIILGCMFLLMVYSFLIVFNKGVMTRSMHVKPYSSQYRVAICISGEVRDITTLETLITQIIIPFTTTGSTCDIYLHCSFRNEDIRDRYISRLKPIIVIERLPTIHNNITQIVFGRIYELHQAILSNNTDYDLYIRTRPDIILSKPLSQTDISAALKGYLGCTPILSTLYITLSKKYISDTFFLANKEVMTELSNIYQHVGTCENPETLLYNYVNKKHMKVYYLSVEVGLSDYMITNAKTAFMLKMLSKISYIPIITKSDCSVHGV